MSKAVQEQVDKLFEAVKDLHSLEEIKPHCEVFNEFINLKTTYTKDSLGTVLSRCGFYKKFKSLPLEQGKNADLVPKHDKEGNIKGHELQHYCLLLCGLSKEDWFDRNNTTRVNDRLSGDGQEVNPETYLQITGKLLESNNPHELAVGLIAATGRRPHEILARAKFTQIKGEEYHVMFEGQGKKRGEKPVFKIATLYPANYIIKKLNQLRELTKDFIREIETEFKNDIATQNRKIEDRRGNSLRRVVQEYFGGKDTETPVLNFRDSEDQNDCKALRAAYLCLATDRDCKGSLGSKMLHAAKLAGHFTNETPTDKDLNHLVTTLGYADYFTTKPVTFPIIKDENMTIKTSNVKINEADLKVIRDCQKKWELPNQQSVVKKLIELAFADKQDNGNQSLEVNYRISEVEAKLLEFTILNEASNEVINKQKLEIENLQELVNKQLETINKQKSKIEELESMETSTATTNNADLKARIETLEAGFQKLEELIKSQAPALTTPAPVPIPPAKTVPTAKDRNQEELELMSHADLWKSRKTGVAEEKVRRCFLVVCDYNENQPSNETRIAPNNQVLRDLAGVNGQVVGAWLKSHQDELIYQLDKYQMQYAITKEGNVYTTANRGRDTSKIMQELKAKLP